MVSDFRLRLAWLRARLRGKRLDLYSELRLLLPRSCSIVEAGAHIGADTQRLAGAFPKGTINAFEPIPELFVALQFGTAPLSNVRCYPLALSDSEGIATCYVSSGKSDGSSSLLPPTGHTIAFPAVLFNKTTQVRTSTLDQWSAQEGVAHVDFMWLDLQGLELRALQGAQRLLEGVSAIYSEVSFKPLYEGGVLYPELKNWLKEQGFVAKWSMVEHETYGNALFTRAKPRVRRQVPGMVGAGNVQA